MKTLNKINDEFLMNVTGGDSGDTDWEKEHGTPLYSVGETVERFNSFLHITTTRGTITDMRAVTENGGQTYWKYLFRPNSALSRGEWVEASDIERKRFI